MSAASATSNRFAYEDEVVYVLGSHQSASDGAHQTVFRAKGAALLGFSFGEMEVLQQRADKTQPETWLPLFSAEGTAFKLNTVAPAQLFAPTTTEASLHYDFSRAQWVVVSLRITDHQIRMCSAVSIAAEWSCAFVAEVDARVLANRELISYAGKAHPDLLSGSGGAVLTAPTSAASTTQQPVGAALEGLVVSYVSNTIRGPKLMFEPEFKTAYAPKFLLIERADTA